MEVLVLPWLGGHERTHTEVKMLRNRENVGSLDLFHGFMGKPIHAKLLAKLLRKLNVNSAHGLGHSCT